MSIHLELCCFSLLISLIKLCKLLPFSTAEAANVIEEFSLQSLSNLFHGINQIIVF
jgi:hypothetical protein